MEVLAADSGRASSLGIAFLSDLRIAGGIEKGTKWHTHVEKPLTLQDHGRMMMVLKQSPEISVTPIGRGVHRPYKLKLQNNEQVDVVTCSEAVAKTAHCQYETKRYCASMDLKITGPEREILSYDLDLALGFNLVPPTVGRHVEELGLCSVQAWVRAPMAIDWYKSKKYNYREHPENPWLHKLAAFDFITGQIDRHAANWIMDKVGRVYAIDNGYSFVKGDNRQHLKSNIGKYLVNCHVHPTVKRLVRSVDLSRVRQCLEHRGFQNDEQKGVLKRLREMQNLEVWGVMGKLWADKK